MQQVQRGGGWTQWGLCKAHGVATTAQHEVRVAEWPEGEQAPENPSQVHPPQH